MRLPISLAMFPAILQEPACAFPALTWLAVAKKGMWELLILGHTGRNMQH